MDKQRSLHIEKLCLLILLFLLGAFSAFSQKVLLNESGFHLEESERKDIQLLAEYEAQIYNGLFSTRKNDSLIITINIFKKFGDYKKAALATGIPVISNTGFYSSGLRQVFVYKHDDFMRTLVHEMSHCFMHFNMGNRVPRWLNEGIAVFFESMEVRYNEVSVAVQSGRISAVKKEVALGNVDLAGFLQLDDAGWFKKGKLDYMYNISYSIVFYIMKTNPAAARQLILALKDGTDAVTAVGSLPYGGFDGFERRYKLFYR